MFCCWGSSPGEKGKASSVGEQLRRQPHGGELRAEAAPAKDFEVVCSGRYRHGACAVWVSVFCPLHLGRWSVLPYSCKNMISLKVLCPSSRLWPLRVALIRPRILGPSRRVWSVWVALALAECLRPLKGAWSVAVGLFHLSVSGSLYRLGLWSLYGSLVRPGLSRAGVCGPCSL